MTEAPCSYLMVSSVLGFYSLRVFEALTPRKDDTTMTTVKLDPNLLYHLLLLPLLLLHLLHLLCRSLCGSVHYLFASLLHRGANLLF